MPTSATFYSDDGQVVKTIMTLDETDPGEGKIRITWSATGVFSVSLEEDPDERAVL